MRIEDIYKYNKLFSKTNELFVQIIFWGNDMKYSIMNSKVPLSIAFSIEKNVTNIIQNNFAIHHDHNKASKDLEFSTCEIKTAVDQKHKLMSYRSYQEHEH